MTPCDSRPQHIAIGLAIPDRRNPYTPRLKAPYHVGGCQSAGKQALVQFAQHVMLVLFV
jgi:hypothetical protein